jgi:miniconductance mechanosensitive channel
MKVLTEVFMLKTISDLLISNGVSKDSTTYLSNVILILFIIFLCTTGVLITKKVILRILAHYINRNKFKWDNIMFDRKVFHRTIHIIPAIIIYFFAPAFPKHTDFIQRGATTYTIIVIIYALDAFLDSINEIYKTFKVSKVKPIKTYLQVIKIFIYAVGIIIIIATLLGKSPVFLLSGIGALSAVLLLVFKDSLLGFVAGVQLAANDMVRIGDWIEMPKYNADGDVIDISLNTVKVENFDKTITTIPTYTLISDSFKNWRGMQASGGRRIKRAIYIDTSSIVFCTNEMIDKFKKYQFLSDYIEKKTAEIAEYNNKHNFDSHEIVNGRRLTNLGTFRAYIQLYLENHENIHKSMSHLVRQLPSGEYGIPLEIYAFTNQTNWEFYENTQADIFDHILAVAPDFGLRIFQNPTGHDLRVSVNNKNSV